MAAAVRARPIVGLQGVEVQISNENISGDFELMHSPSTAFVVARTGGAERNRTADLFIANEALYQLSYSPPWGAGR